MIEHDENLGDDTQNLPNINIISMEVCPNHHKNLAFNLVVYNVARQISQVSHLIFKTSPLQSEHSYPYFNDEENKTQQEAEPGPPPRETGLILKSTCHLPAQHSNT